MHSWMGKAMLLKAAPSLRDVGVEWYCPSSVFLLDIWYIRTLQNHIWLQSPPILWEINNLHYEAPLNGSLEWNVKAKTKHESEEYDMTSKRF